MTVNTFMSLLLCLLFQTSKERDLLKGIGWITVSIYHIPGLESKMNKIHSDFKLIAK